MIGTKNVADLLIKNGANINSITDDGDTALHLATLSGTLLFDTLQKNHWIKDSNWLFIFRK